MQNTHPLIKKLPAFVLILMGVFLLLNIGNVLLTLIFFVTITLPGLGFLWVYNRGEDYTAPFAIPATLTIGTGLLLMYQSLTGYWESWAFAWILYGVFLGLGLMMMGRRLNERELVKIGRLMTIISGVAFIAIGSLVIFFTTALLKYGIVLALVGGGLYLLKDGDLLRFEKRKNSDENVQANIHSLKVDVEQEIA